MKNSTLTAIQRTPADGGYVPRYDESRDLILFEAIRHPYNERWFRVSPTLSNRTFLEMWLRYAIRHAQDETTRAVAERWLVEAVAASLTS